MKRMKKFVGLLLTMMLVLGMVTTALAATVTIPNTGILKDHSFKAYQVFAGREDTVEGKTFLSDIKWGDGIEEEEFLAALKASDKFKGGDPAENVFKDCTTAAAVAEKLGQNVSFADEFAKLAEDHKKGEGTTLNNGDNTLADGYYLVVDTTTDVAAGSAKNAALLQVVGDITIKVKTDAPTVEKKVKENETYGDVADYNIGDDVPFLLIGSVPDMSRYDTYKYKFQDTLSEGLTAPANAEIKVYLSADENLNTEEDTDITNKFIVTVSGQKITVSCEDIKGIDGIASAKYIFVEYSAKLNASAEIGLDGNTNTVKLVYSNNPDNSGSGEENNTGETPEDKVIVFTYELDVTKVDGSNDQSKLQGAEFVLLNSDATKVAIIENDKFARWENVPIPVDGKIDWQTGAKLTSDANGLFKVPGLDAGTYKLREIKAPEGYNILTTDIELVITAEKALTWNGENANTALTKLTITVGNGTAVDGNLDTGVVSMEVKNNAGAQLPSTGGMGTTMFYVVGAILVVAAVVLLVTKRRMNND